MVQQIRIQVTVDPAYVASAADGRIVMIGAMFNDDHRASARPRVDKWHSLEQDPIAILSRLTLIAKEWPGVISVAKRLESTA